MFRLLSILCVFTLLPITSHAQVNDQGAQVLTNFVNGLLDYQKNTGEAFGTVKVEYEGDVKVEQMSDYYAVTFPRILLSAGDDLVEEEGETAGFEVDLGVIMMSVAPDTEEGYWKSILQFPDSIVLRDAGETEFAINIGEQNSVALLSERLGYFTKLNINLSDITFESGEEDELGFSLGGIQIVQNMTDEGNGVYSGPYAFSFKNMRIAPPHENEYMFAEEFKLDGNLDQVVLPTLAEYETKVMRFIEAMNAVEQGDEAAEGGMSDEDVMNALIDMYVFDWNGFSANYSVKNFEFKSNDSQEGVSLDNGSFGMSVAGLRSDTGAVQFGVSYGGLEMNGVEYDAAKQYTPEDLNIDLKLDKVPYNSLYEMAEMSMQSVVANPEAAQMVGMGLMMRVPSLLTQSGTTAEAKGFSSKGDVYNVTLDGAATADLKAIMGVTAQFKTVFEGLDTVLSMLKADENVSEFSGVIGDLEHFKSIGVQDKGPNGKPAYSYTFEITTDGKMLLNGQDAMTALPQ